MGKGTVKPDMNSFPVSRILDEEKLVHLIQDGINNGERFCFILGSGASVKSGIPTGQTFEKDWMDHLMGKGSSHSTPEISEKLAKNLQADDLLANSFEDIKKDWEAVEEGKKEKMDSRYYDDLFRLRYFYRKQDGYKFLEDSMKDAFPSLGYHPLALFLTQKNGNNLVITLNFDSLVEDALALYTTEKPQVINHEHLTQYLDFGNTTRPLVAKLHHGLFFAPINDSSKVSEEWTKNWTDKLSLAFHTFTPIVIGYNGGDVSFMNILKIKFPSDKQLYWCALHSPNEDYFNPEVRNFLMDSDQRFFVTIRGFDELMLKIGQKMFREKIGVDAVIRENKKKVADHIAQYSKQFLALITANIPQSASDFFEKAEQILWSISSQTPSNSCADYTLAIDAYTKAIELYPEYSDAYQRRGLIMRFIGEYDAAINEFSKAIEIDPFNAFYYLDRGITKSDKDDYIGAIEDYSNAIKIESNVTFYSYRGSAYFELRCYPQAIDDYSKVIELSPYWIFAYFQRATAYTALGQHDLAEADRKKAAELEGKTT